MKTLFPFLALLLFSTGCAKNQSNHQEESNAIQDSIRKYPPVETKPAHSHYQPAFPGQTRTFGIRTTTPLKIDILTKSLKQPWSIKELPDGRFLVTQKDGNMVILGQDGRIQNTITGFPQVSTEGQGGLLDVFIDPDYTDNRMVYFTFTQDQGNGMVTTLAKGKITRDDSKIEDVQILYKAEPSFPGGLNNGSRVIMDGDGNLLFSTGDRFQKSIRINAQNLKSGLGKIIRITTDGQPAAGNPFLNDPKTNPYIYSYGHRNVEGLTLDPVHNLIYETEMGPMGGDEINIIKAGQNYGWPIISYGLEYSGDKVGAGITQKQGMTQPIYYWDPSVSPSGVKYYDSHYIPEWKGDLIIGALGGQHIIRLRIVDGKVEGEERLLQDQNQRFRDIDVSRGGLVYAITDSGWLYRISKK